MLAIRTAIESDLDEILLIYNEIIKNTTAVYDYEPHTIDMRKRWFEAKQKDKLPVFVAQENDAIVGFSTIGPFRAWAAYKHTVENSVYVSGDRRGRGIGKLLLKPLIKASIEMDMHTIIAAIDASNQSSIRLHESFGFREVAHFKEVGYKFNRWLDLKFFQLMLS